MKRILTFFALTFTLAAGAQGLRIEHLSDTHSMVRVESKDRYVLLPVQESAPEARVRVLSNGQERLGGRHYLLDVKMSQGRSVRRDPKLFWDAQSRQWKVVLAAGQEVQFYSSDNLKDWTYDSSFGLSYGNHNGVWECPDLIRLLVDSASIEAFGEDFSMTNMVFPSAPYTQLRLHGGVKADVTLYPLAK